MDHASGHLPAPLRVREEAHRRGVLVGMGALIVFSTSPVFGHHLATSAEALLAGRDHFLNVCLIALHMLLEPVHETFHLLLVAGLVYAIWDRGRAWVGLRTALGAVAWDTPTRDGVLAGAARRAGLALDQIREVQGLPNPAFTAGWFTPRIYVASALAHQLSTDELTAVLAHEGAHVERRDPLRLSLLRFLACTLFYLPALRRLAADAADEAEIAADDAAVTRKGVPALALASAILEIARCWGRATTATAFDLDRSGAAVGFQSVDLLDRRVRRLLGEDATVGTHVTRRSLAGAGAALAAVWMSGLMMAHPLPPGVEADAGFLGFSRSSTNTSARATATAMRHGTHDDSHCEHHGTFALMHLFCLGLGEHAAGTPCPHAVTLHQGGRHTA